MVSTRSGSSVKKSPKSPTLEPRHATRRHKLIEDDSNDDESDFLSLKSSKKEFLSVEFSHDTPKSLYNDSPVLKRPSRRREPSRHLNDEEEYLSKVERQKRNHTRSLFSLGLEDEGSSCEEDGIGSLAASSRARTSSRDKNFPNMLLRRGINGENQVDRNEIKYRERARSQSKEHVNPELRSLLKAQGKDPASALNSSQPDIYSSIKSRHRLRRPRVFYGDYEFATSSSQSRLEDDPNTSTEVGDLGSDPKEQDLHQNDVVEDEDDLDDDNEVPYRRYSLRTKRAQPHRLNYELIRQPRRNQRTMFDQLPRSPVRRKRVFNQDQHNPTSPYQSRHRRTNSQGASSSGSTSASDDEKKFERRKKRSMAKARNKCLPMNFSSSELATHGFAREREKIGSSLADVDPMSLDKSVKFSSIGGHKHHIRSLKEMIVFPLIYPEVFTKFSIAPPRGCLFYGPPGTGKTLMARALANECSTDDKKVAFFMRKGADCLSKWVGESERQLRLLFDQAYQMRPSIIFFDEIDGLAPVRSSRQDQIHSSIVSTLLALMDGLDSRGEIVVIGATNRIDSIDPALRRPGRFDREFLFPLPDKKSRHDILKIHTSKWDPPLSSNFIETIAEKTVGYCGADLKALCTEATLNALRKSFPQIYSTNDKLKFDVDKIKIGPNNFYRAMKSIIPTAQRSNSSPAFPLNPTIRPLLQTTLIRAITQLARIFPITLKKSKLLKNVGEAESRRPSEVSDDSGSEYEEPDSNHCSAKLPHNGLSMVNGAPKSYRSSVVHHPRMLICGSAKGGHTTHLAPAILHDIEGLHVHVINIATLYAVSSCTPEESCAQVFREAKRTSPCIIYLPSITTWWDCATDTLRFTFQSHLQALPTNAPILVIGTSDEPHPLLPRPLSSFFHPQYNEVISITKPTDDERTLFFSPIFTVFALRPPVERKSDEIHLPKLDRASPPPVVELTQVELNKLELSEESTMRSLRLFLRDVLTRLAQDRRFKVFLKPVDLEEVPDYADVIENPMDISTMMNKIDQHRYQNVALFLHDIGLVCSNALEYNPDLCAEDKSIRHRACLLRDMAHAIVEEDLDPNFERKCNEVIEAQKRRKANPNKFAPSYYNVLPKQKRMENNEATILQEATVVLEDHMKATPTKSSAVKKRTRRRNKWACGMLSKKKRPKLDMHVRDDPETNGVISTEDEESNDVSSSKSSTKMEVQNGIKSRSPSPGEEKDAGSESSPKIISSDENPANTEDENLPSANQDDGWFSRSKKLAYEKDAGSESSTKMIFPDLPTAEDDLIVCKINDEHPPDSAFHQMMGEDEMMENEVSSDANIDLCEEDEDKSDTEEVSNKIEKVDDPDETSRTRTPSLCDAPTNETSSQPLIVDTLRLNQLLEYTVKVTSKLDIADLERLYSILTRSIYKHRHQYDKTQLVQDLQNEVIQFMSSVPGDASIIS